MQDSKSGLLKGRYKIEEQLGEGGMGTVYLALDTSVERQVAVKSNLSTVEHSLRQFEREARLLAGVRHPNLPLVTDHFIIDDVQYLVMDFIPGIDLSKKLKSEGSQPVELVISWAKQLASALTYLHNQVPPVIHRDIKPGNIKLTPQGDVVLVDFGIAKVSDTATTTTGARGFTPGYAPPEQYGSGSTGPYSDQYALAATLYALMSARSPVESVERMLDQATLIPIGDLVPNIKPHVEDAIHRGLELIPENRYVNVDEFVDALSEPKFKATVGAKTMVNTQLKAPKKRRPFATIISIIFITLITAGGFFFSGGFGAGNDPSNNSSGNNSQSGVIPIAEDLATETPTETSLPPTPSPTATQTPTVTPTPTITLEPTVVGGGGLIAFVSNRDDARIFQVFTMNTDGSNLTQLTFDTVTKSQPTWSPDGTKLLYVANGGTSFGTDLGLDIWIMDPDGGNQINLTLFAGDDTDPAWFPDGSKIAFTSTRVADVRQIFFMDADGANPDFISRGYSVEYQPFWSPDGEWLIFSSTVNDGPPTLRLRTGLGADPRAFDISYRLGEASNPSWSPDGIHIAYEVIFENSQEIYIAIADESGDSLFQLTTTLGNKEPNWSSDSQWIVFTSSRDGNSEIYIMNVNGVIQTRVTDNEATDKEPSWQPTFP